MGNEVYANNMEVSCKAANGKSIAAFPDVCFTPPLTPATPPGVPIPYPNTGMASDTTDGSKTVQVSGEEVMLKDKSCFKQSTGDEAGSAPKKGVVTSKIKGKVYFAAWSMDVKFEGENVVRNLDMTTHNHGSVPSNTGPWPYIDAVSVPKSHPCHDDIEREQTACAKTPTKAKRCGKSDAAKACREAQKCKLAPFSQKRCCKGEQRHHLVEVHSFSPKGKRGTNLKGLGGYDDAKAPTVCAKGSRHNNEHGLFHAIQQTLEACCVKRGKVLQKWPNGDESRWTYKEARDTGVLANSKVYPHCNPKCTEKQLDNYHTQDKPKGPGVSNDTPLRTDPAASGRIPDVMDAATKKEVAQAAKAMTGITNITAF
jgi:hypothetical protein